MGSLAHEPTTAARRRAAAHRAIRDVSWLFPSLLARLSAPWLDRNLAAGVEPSRSAVYAARARQLTGARSRHIIAVALERLIADGEKPKPSRSAVVQPSLVGLRDARPVMRGLASRLHSGASVDARTVLALKRLLVDGTGPCYVDEHPDTLRMQLEAIRDHWATND